VRKADNLATFILRVSTSWSLKGLSWPVQGSFKNTDIKIDISVHPYKNELALIILISCILMA
jgi:hypothetical protein